MHVVAESYVTDTHKHTHTHIHTHIRDNYSNPRCVCAPRVNYNYIELAFARSISRAAKSPAFAGDLPVFVILGAYLPSSRLDTSMSRFRMAYLQHFSSQLS